MTWLLVLMILLDKLASLLKWWLCRSNNKGDCIIYVAILCLCFIFFMLNWVYVLQFLLGCSRCFLNRDVWACYAFVTQSRSNQTCNYQPSRGWDKNMLQWDFFYNLVEWDLHYLKFFLVTMTGPIYVLKVKASILSALHKILSLRSS
jgi:hypothetical protein